MKNTGLTRCSVALAALSVFCITALRAQPQNLPHRVLPPDPASPFSLVAEVSPSPAPIGSRLALRLTITNSSRFPASFAVKGCPVHYRIDGAFSPSGDCEDMKRQIDLNPGQTVSFGPRDTPHLIFDPKQFPVGPGVHRVVMAMKGVGAAEAEFVIERGNPRLASLVGRVLDLEGNPVTDGHMILSRGIPDAPQTAIRFGTHDVARVDLSDRGGFFFTEVEPQGYLLRVITKEHVLWYPGVMDPRDAERIALSPGGFRNDVELMFRLDPGTHPLAGRVYEQGSIIGSMPLPEAAVMAIPLLPENATTAPLATGPLELAGVHLAMTGPDGSFRLDLPRGAYRLLAGKLVDHQYQYWNHSAGFGEASLIRVPQVVTSHETIRFDIQRLEDATLGEVSGRVLLYDPQTDLPPVPGVKVQVTAIPVLPSTFATTAPHGVQTSENGTFRLAVPADTPYLVRAETKGYRSQAYRHTDGPAAGQWVDVKPGRTRGSVDFVLLAKDPTTQLGSITGSVFTRLPDEACRDLDPAACLVPAEGIWIQVSPAFPALAPMEFRAQVQKDGSYRVNGLISGGDRTYYVSAHLEGLDPRYAPVGVVFSGADPVPVYSGKTSNAGRIVLPPRGSRQDRGRIAGTVTDRKGNPLDRVLIRVYLRPEYTDAREFRGMTNSAGVFVFEGLPEGADVLVSAEADGLVPVYYPGVYRWRDAERVTTGGPRRRANTVSFSLDRGPVEGPYVQPGQVETVPVTGPGTEDLLTLVELPATPLRSAFFYLLDPYSSRPEIPVAGASSRENGSVLLSGLDPGHYVVYADHPGFESAKYGGDATPTLLWIGENASETRVMVRLNPVKDGETSLKIGVTPALVTHLYNVPNPFRPQTAIRYQLKEPAQITVQVFDYRGRLVRTLIEDRSEDPGAKEIFWNGTDEDGTRVSSGVYFYRILAGSFSVSRKMVLLP